MSAHPTWTMEREDAMRALLADSNADYSSAQVASILSKQFKIDLSRNAVIGRCKRQGIALNPDKRIGANPKGPKPERKPKPAQPPRLRSRPAPQLRCDPLKAGTFHVTELEAGMCKWPSGDGPFLFCGRWQVEGTPYCPGHCRIAYRSLA